MRYCVVPERRQQERHGLVFERVEGDHRRPDAGTRVAERGETPVQGVQALEVQQRNRDAVHMHRTGASDVVAHDERTAPPVADDVEPVEAARVAKSPIRPLKGAVHHIVEGAVVRG